MSKTAPEATRSVLLRMLWVIVGMEVLFIGTLLGWALMRSDQTPQASTPNTAAPKQIVLAKPSVALAQFATGLIRPVDIAAAPGTKSHRLFVVEQAGTIHSLSVAGQVEEPAFLDITSKVLDDGGEMGLLGLVFHPKFAENGYFYVDYVDKQQYTTIARYTLDKQTSKADPASEKVVLKIKQPYPNHKGGDLSFGPDGYLYIAMGDGGSGGDPENRAQNKNELLGKLLRIDVNKGDPYAIPADNPFAKGGGKPEIWALGLRNPWRFSFDRQTHDLFIGDVGQNVYEEVDVAKAGGAGGQNYGWRCLEAAHEFKTDGCQAASAYIAPTIEYDHTEGRCSITGGFVYRGKQFPALHGDYFYADYCGGQVYTAKAADNWQPTIAATTKYRISTFGEDNTGELYLADLLSGTIFHITDTANPPQ